MANTAAKIQFKLIYILNYSKPDLKAMNEYKRSPLRTANLVGFNPVMRGDINSLNVVVRQF
uniref:Uncharacterized protein n=1 Tax=Megaselia scalaris TaxID=36166 RepID=T1GFI6_MEGSC